MAEDDSWSASGSEEEEELDQDQVREILIEKIEEQDPNIFNVKINDLKGLKKIGEGNFGRIWKATYFGTKVAVKQLLDVDDQDMHKYIVREMMTLRRIRHPNIVQLIGLSKHESDHGVFIIMEYVSGGNLRERLKDQSQPLPWSERISYGLDIASSLNFLHSQGFIHRDLKSHNILLEKTGRVKLCDFGFARLVEKAEIMTVCGTDQWMAPEVALGRHYDVAADVFSFGMILYEIFTREKPPERKVTKAFAVDYKLMESSLPPGTPQGLAAVMLLLIRYYPNERGTLDDAIKALKTIRKRVLKEEKESANKEAALKGSQPEGLEYMSVVVEESGEPDAGSAEKETKERAFKEAGAAGAGPSPGAGGKADAAEGKNSAGERSISQPRGLRQQVPENTSGPSSRPLAATQPISTGNLPPTTGVRPLSPPTTVGAGTRPRFAEAPLVPARTGQAVIGTRSTSMPREETAISGYKVNIVLSKGYSEGRSKNRTHRLTVSGTAKLTGPLFQSDAGTGTGNLASGGAAGPPQKKKKEKDFFKKIFKNKDDKITKSTEGKVFMVKEGENLDASELNLSEDELDDLIMDMLSSVELSENKYKGKAYPNSFTGKAAVEMLIKNFYTDSPKSAQFLLSYLLKRRAITVLTSTKGEDNKFKEKHLYTFPYMNADDKYVNHSKKWVTKPTRSPVDLSFLLLKALQKVVQMQIEKCGPKVQSNICNEYYFRKLLLISSELQIADLSSASQSEQIIFWINVRNFLALYVFCVEGRPSTPLKQNHLWQNYSIQVGHGSVNLHQIENGILFGTADDLVEAFPPLRVEPLLTICLYDGSATGPPLHAFEPKTFRDDFELVAREWGRNLSIRKKDGMFLVPFCCKLMLERFNISPNQLLDMLIPYMSSNLVEFFKKAGEDGVTISMDVLPFDYSAPLHTFIENPSALRL
mmetsp:Transcript_8420/g.23739  ORF Transcript_8420/g.23739 Transcript_8420/m.23739 type:complete len:931 (+) Transcript_8420:88-2880(+)|eukprot:CAMPEP_0119133928 /NCGR_PEP_ID=MMETSP1310-20130426/14491_1 /TAXON_ID=464262 /ORGANISM="Genus nov. species nov., Strain RCC2339" /LENGTH=930 /DNA_ID=CAMNT_0007124663 /DNA_START=75 /DNA_END=2867 /DNA_ORIENTATION=+